MLTLLTPMIGDCYELCACGSSSHSRIYCCNARCRSPGSGGMARRFCRQKEQNVQFAAFLSPPRAHMPPCSDYPELGMAPAWGRGADDTLIAVAAETLAGRRPNTSIYRSRGHPSTSMIIDKLSHSSMGVGKDRIF